jgi:hypothetical protein
MSKRSMPGFAVLGLAAAFAVAACDSKEPAKSSGPTSPQELALLDVNDPASLDSLAKEFGIEVQPFEMPSVHRGASEAVAFLMYPSGEVRKDGLATYRVDVGEDYRNDGTLQFREGKKVLWKGQSAFNPARAETVSNLPKEVLDAVKAGDTVTWGIFFEDKRKPIKTEFRVVDKTQVAKKLGEFANSKSFKKQAEPLQQLAKASLFQNYGLHSEALATYLDVVAKNPDFQQAHQGIVASLRRLDLTDAPLFAREMGKVVPTKPRLAGGGVSGGGSDPIGGGIAGRTPDVPNVPNTPAMAEGTEGGGGTIKDPYKKRTEPGSKKPATGGTSSSGGPTAPTGEISGTDPVTPEFLKAFENAQKAQGEAEEAARRNQEAQLALEAAQAAANAAREAEEQANADLATDPTKPEFMDAAQKAAEARTAADIALRKAEEAAEAAKAAAEAAAKQASDADAVLAALKAAGKGPVTPESMTSGGGPVTGPTGELTKFAEKAIDKANQAIGSHPNADQSILDASKALNDAEQAQEAARIALEADPLNPALQEAYTSATETALAAMRALDAARALLGQSDAAKQAIDAFRAAQTRYEHAKLLATSKPNDPKAQEALVKAAKAVEEAAAHLMKALGN